MTRRVERRISHTELTIVAIRCKHCSGEIRIDFSVEAQTNRVQEGGVIACPLCGYNFDSDVNRALKRLVSFRAHLDEHENEVFFCIEDGGTDE